MNKASHQIQRSRGDLLSFFLGILMAFFFGFLILNAYSLLLWARHGKGYALSHALNHLYNEAQSLKAFQSSIFTHTPQKMIDDFLLTGSQWLSKGEAYLAEPFRAVADKEKGDHFFSVTLESFKAFNERLSLPLSSGLFKVFGEIIVTNVEIVFCKAVTLLFSLPLFLAFALIGFTDGLNQRAIRKAELGRESSYVFHRLSHYLSLSFMLGLGVWIALPFNLEHELVFIPAAFLLGFMILQTASRFKKHL